MSDSNSNDRPLSELLETFKKIDSALCKIEIPDLNDHAEVQMQVKILCDLGALLTAFSAEAGLDRDDFDGLCFQEVLDIFKREVDLLNFSQELKRDDMIQTLKRCFRLLPALVGRAGDWYAFFDYDLTLSDEARTNLNFLTLEFHPD